MTRLRQIALVSASLRATTAELEATLGDVLAPGFADPGVGEFGLENAVFAVGDTFVEVVAPVREGTTAGRYLAKHGLEAGGYMALFQLDDLAAARARVAALGIRVVWQADLADIAGTHLHPKDVPGAIVSLDQPLPPSSWRWGGPSWTGGAPAFEAGTGIVGLTVACASPASVAGRWAEVLGADLDGTSIALDGGRQRLDFIVASEPGMEAITAVTLAVTPGHDVGEVTAGGVSFARVAARRSPRSG
ncbi:MAG: hypothetical protein QOF60_761 [Actinomycetota bacterium]|jgi:hypothetical protein|nr:hypothetical protein [Actinomycetota bacterium]